MAKEELRSAIKARLRDLRERYQAELDADAKKKGYMDKLMAFFKETDRSDTARWEKLNQRVSEFATRLAPPPPPPKSG